MKQVTRFDYSQIKARKTDEGFLRDEPIVARVGIQEYRKADGSIQRELRLPEEVFNADSLASFVGKPITVDHPTAGKVDANNAHRLTVGTMLESGKQDGENVRANIVIHSPNSIGDRRELSLGYSCKLDETPGEWNGQKYDAIQREIRVNHLSVVKRARAGAIARLNLDSDEEVNEEPFQQPEYKMTVKVKLDSGIEYEVAPEVAAALEKQRNDAAGAAAEANAKISKLEAERDTFKARVDAMPSELEKARAQGRADAAARAALENVAAAFKVDCKEKSDREVKEAVIKSVRADADLKDKSDVYVDAAFDMAVEVKGDAAMARQRVDANAGKGEGGYKSAKQRYDEARTNKFNTGESK